MAKKKETTEIILIPPLEKGKMIITLVGDTPLIVHAWAEKAKKQILAKQMKKAKQGKEARDPARDYRESLYWLNKKGERIAPKKEEPSKHGNFGFKTIAFKASAVRAANDVGMLMTLARRAFHILGEYVVIEHKKIKSELARARRIEDTGQSL